MSLQTELNKQYICEIRPVEIIPGESKDSSDQIYASQVLCINDDDTIDFSIPTLMGKQVDLLRNTRYSFLFIRSHSMKTAHGVFLQRIRIDNVPMARVKLVTPLKKIQRRDYFRIGCHIDMHFQVIRMRAEDFLKPGFMEKVSECIDGDSWKKGTIMDISGGGMKFSTEAPVMDLPYIFMTFKLSIEGEEKRIGITGKILSRQPVPRSLLCTHRVKFEPEHSRAQNDILAFVASEQRKLAKKEQGK